MTDAAVIDHLLRAFCDLGNEIGASGTPDTAMKTLTARSLVLVGPAEHASISRATDRGWETVAPTSDVAAEADAIQYELGTGPCVDAAMDSTTYLCGDLRDEPRWPDFGKRAVTEVGVHSMLAFRMFFEEDSGPAALNLYATETGAFSEEDRLTGLVLSTYGALAVTSARRLDRIVNLERALESNRDIGVGIGVLMGLYRVTREQAFDLLRMTSQARHRKLRDVAKDVADTGTLEIF
jgi:hypothetical protein